MPGYWRFLQIECQLEQMIVQFFTLKKKAGTVHENFEKKIRKNQKSFRIFREIFSEYVKKNLTN